MVERVDYAFVAFSQRFGILYGKGMGIGIGLVCVFAVIYWLSIAHQP
jgi:tetrahydromethanopterin S-methyltransferase subunit G